MKERKAEQKAIESNIRKFAEVSDTEAVITVNYRPKDSITWRDFREKSTVLFPGSLTRTMCRIFGG